MFNLTARSPECHPAARHARTLPRVSSIPRIGASVMPPSTATAAAPVLLLRGNVARSPETLAPQLHAAAARQGPYGRVYVWIAGACACMLDSGDRAIDVGWSWSRPATRQARHTVHGVGFCVLSQLRHKPSPQAINTQTEQARAHLQQSRS